MTESLDVTSHVLNSSYRDEIEYIVFTDKRSKELSFHILDRGVKLIPKHGFLKDRVILPAFVVSYFPVKDFVTGEFLPNPYEGFGTFTLEEIEVLNENSV